MMEQAKIFWNDRSPREQWMLAVMAALLVVVVLWLGLFRPLDAAQRSARDRLLEATDRNASIRAKVKLLKALPAGGGLPARDAAIDQLVGQSAGEAGLTLERAQAQGPGRIDIAIASVRPVALFSWLASLEGMGVRVETMTARPGATAGSVSVQAVLVGGGAR